MVSLSAALVGISYYRRGAKRIFATEVGTSSALELQKRVRPYDYTTTAFIILLNILPSAV